MDKRNHVYRLKNGREVSLIASYRDYFSDEMFLVLKENDQIFVAHALEFSANIELDSKISRRSADEKIKLYRNYFRGNDHMVATSFENSAGKRVYYVWCQQHKKGPCPKLKNQNFKCSLCKYQKFQPLTDQVIFDHLRGFNNQKNETFYGIYPITPENTVYFLAFDFDKQDWKLEVSALVQSVEKFKLKPLLELSQSGNGCHVWLFFETAISAKKARKLGNLLLRYTMLSYPKLSFDSFDRLFPSQDEIIVGGFGNLIALPLQGNRVKKGSSRFINREFKTIEDIWGALEKTPKISNKTIDRIIQEIEKKVPIQYYKAPKKEEILLLEESESFEESCNESIRIIATNELIIDRSEVSDKALVQLKFLATFHNQAFYLAQRKRLSTYGIPRVICLAEVDDEKIKLPRGLQEKVTEMFPNSEYIDQYKQGKKLTVAFNGELYGEQSKALNALEQKNIGILCAGTGFGKTVIAAKLIADKRINTLILVNSKNLAVQWKAQLERFLTIDDQPFEEYTKTGRKRKKDQIGKIYGGQEIRSGLVDIALFQSITKQPDLENLLNQYGMIIVDEAHHVAAKTFEDVIKKASCRYLYGLTATPKREDHLENILYMRLGDIAYTAEKKIPKHVDQKLYIRFTSLGEQDSLADRSSLHDNYEKILQSSDRNQQIIKDICDNIKEKRHMIVLSRYVKHLNILKRLLENTEIEAPIYILNSKMKNKEIREELAMLKQEGKSFILLTTGSYAGEGFDLPALDTLMLVMPISGKGSLQQYLGRLLRDLEEKNELRVYDYIDYAIPMTYRMYQKRLRTYKQLGYQINEDNETELSKSNLFTSEYLEVLSKDLENAHEGLLVFPYLDRKICNQLTLLNTPKNFNLVLPKISDVKEKRQEIYQSQVDQLSRDGFKIKFQNNLTQHFVVLDQKIVWMLPNSSENSVTLRILSLEIANRLTSHFIL